MAFPVWLVLWFCRGDDIVFKMLRVLVVLIVFCQFLVMRCVWTHGIAINSAPIKTSSATTGHEH